MTRARSNSGEPWGGESRFGHATRLAGLHLPALIGFSVAQPVYDLLGRYPDFLVAHDASPLDLLVLVMGLSVLFPMALLGGEVLTALLSRRAALWLHRGLLALLVGVVALQTANQLTPLPGWLLLGLAATVGAAGTAAYARLAWLRTFLTALSPAALVFPLIFLFGTPVATLLTTNTVPVAALLRSEPTTPVVMVIFDEFPTFSIMDQSEQIDAARYPHLAALASSAYWFPNATTVADATTHAVPAIFSGRYPDRSGPRLAIESNYPKTLLTLLGGTYDLRVIESETSLCSANLCGTPRRHRFAERMGVLFSDLRFVYLHLIVPTDLATGLTPVSAGWKNFGGHQETTADRDRHRATTARRSGPPGEFARFLESLRPGRESTLYSIHLMLPHVPWKYLPSGKQYGPPGMGAFPHGMRTANHWANDEWEIAQAFQRYLLQLGYVDRLIGELVATLKDTGLYESCLLVLVADHGVSFRAGDRRRGLTESNFAEITNVPLLVKLPRQRAGVISGRNVQTIDVLPTIADVLGLEIPWKVDGQSVIDFSLPNPPEKKSFRNRGPDEPFVFDVETLATRRAETLDWAHALFGSGLTPRGLFRGGPHPELLEQNPRDHVIAKATALRIHLDATPRWGHHYDPQGPFAPTHITGRVIGWQAGNAPLELAVAVNGVVRAVTRTFGRKAKFTAMVPESALTPGRNRVEVFAISEHEGRTLLQAIPRDRSPAGMPRPRRPVPRPANRSRS